MRSFAIKVVVNAAAIWVATLVVPGLGIAGGRDVGLDQQLLTFALVGLIFGIVNAVVKPVVRLLAMPLYVLSLGLFAFVVNALMLQLTAWISARTPLVFEVEAFFWSAILGAVVVTFVSMVLNLLLRD